MTSSLAIEAFPLAWRWTSEAHSRLPREVLAQIKPLSAADAAHLYSKLPLPSDRATSEISAADQSSAEAWLDSLGFGASPVLIAWSSELAVTLPWKVFLRDWPDFFYPSSDDGILFEQGVGTLEWQHCEYFRYFREPRLDSTSNCSSQAD